MTEVDRSGEQNKALHAALADIAAQVEHAGKKWDVLIWKRLRDAALGCVSCDKPATWAGQWHASHFRSVGSSPEHRFNPLNVHRACSVCNNHLSGNILGYQPELIRRIGLEAVETLLGPSEPKRYTIEDLKAITAEYRAKTRELKRAAA
ncbi:recombination protein NinG [Pseudomonas veronii]|nr:recombination protein NinG [Pseudomonas veronii]